MFFFPVLPSLLEQFGALGTVLSTFDNLREYSMLSLNLQDPITPLALDSEYAIVMLYHKKCSTLRAIILRSVCWVHVEGPGGNYWCPRADNLQLWKIWDNASERELMSTKMAEDALHPSDSGTSEDSSGDYVSMDLDSASEEASDYEDQQTVHHLLSADIQETDVQE